MREAAWSDYEEPLFIHGPDGGVVYFGSQVGWSPRRENQPEIGCKTCGGVLVYMADDLDAPVSIPFRYDRDTMILAVPETDPLNPTSGVCSSCLRWIHDNWMASLLASEYDRRGSNDPRPVSIPEGGTVPIRVEHLEAPSDG